VSDSPGSNASPTPSSVSVTPKRKFSDIEAIAEEPDSESAVPEASESPGRPVKIQKREHGSSKTDLLALDVDYNYQPPVAEKSIKPGLCRPRFVRCLR
jgi:hypothetical protein